MQMKNKKNKAGGFNNLSLLCCVDAYMNLKKTI